MALNAVTTTDAQNNRKLDKLKSPEKIDGMVAWLKALSEASAWTPKPQVKVSFFE